MRPFFAVPILPVDANYQAYRGFDAVLARSAWMHAQYEERGAKFLLNTTVKACKDENGAVCGVRARLLG